MVSKTMVFGASTAAAFVVVGDGGDGGGDNDDKTFDWTSQGLADGAEYYPNDNCTFGGDAGADADAGAVG